jgi:hypothetical protein
MAATSKMRIYNPKDEIFPLVYSNPLVNEIYKHGRLHSILDVEFNDTPAGTSYAEVSAPTAVFDGTTLDKTLGLVSSHADDTDAANKAVREVTIIGIKKVPLTNEQYIQKVAVKTSGTTVADISTIFSRVFHAYASAWGSAGSDATGNITISTHGYQEFGLSSLTSSTLSGLAATTQYYFKVNLDGAGATEYNITTTTDVTIGALITKINTALTATGARISLVGGDLRITSTLTIGAGSTIAVTAGTTGTDLLATLTGFTAMETAIDGVVYLTIAAGDNESSGAAFFIPDDCKCVCFHEKVNLSAIPAAGDLEFYNYFITGGVEGDDPDSNVSGTEIVLGLYNLTSEPNPSIIPIDENTKLTIKSKEVAHAILCSGRMSFCIFTK